MVSQAKIYIRPIQKDLSLSPLEESNDMCMQCKQNIVIHKLREHLKECLGTALVNQSEQYHVSLENSLDDWSSMGSPTSPIYQFVSLLQVMRRFHQQMILLLHLLILLSLQINLL